MLADVALDSVLDAVSGVVSVGFVAGQDSPETQKELLRERKDFLKKQLEAIDKQLED